VDQRAVDGLFAAAYDELRRVAARVRSRDPRATLSPTALVGEAWLKLRGNGGASGLSDSHFKHLAARAMRQVLVEAARRRRAHKRGGAWRMVTFDEHVMLPAAGPAEVLALDTALEALARLSPRQAALVECRFFGGMDVAETAAVLSISEATVLRDWRAARAWLGRELRSSR
jgi:RNA polymerase sigma factor (TIGR02999 family)